MNLGAPKTTGGRGWGMGTGNGDGGKRWGLRRTFRAQNTWNYSVVYTEEPYVLETISERENDRLASSLFEFRVPKTLGL